MNNISKILTIGILLVMGYIGYSGLTKAKPYNEFYRDGVIRNWQSKVSANQQCARFKSEFLSVGSLYDNAVNGKFANDMNKVWQAVKVANCAV